MWNFQPCGPESSTLVMGTVMREELHDNIVRRVESEFAEMPGLLLTDGQAQRLWALDRDTCVVILGELVAKGFLKRGTDGMYRRTSTDPVRPIARSAKAAHHRRQHDAA